MSTGTELVIKGNQLPENPPALAKFILFNRERLVAIRANIRALVNVDLAKEILEQKKEEATMVAEALLDAEVRLGEILPPPRSTRNDLGQVKGEKTLPNGITKQQANHFRALASNKDIVEKVKADARADDKLPTREEVLCQIKEKKKQAIKEAEAKRIAAARLAYGALSEDEKIKLILGDCLQKLPDIPDDSVDFIIVDPPFNVELPYRTHDDSMTAEEYYSWCLAWMKQLYRVLKIHHFVLIASGYSNEKLVQKAIEESGLTYLHPISWYKPNCQCTLAGSGLFYRVEKMFLCSKGVPDIGIIDRPKFYEDIVTLDNSTPKQPDAVDHPAARPVVLYQYFFEGLTKPNDLILDPMFGSGSTAVAAKILGRRYVGIEIDEYYHAMGVDRVNKMKEGRC